MAAPETTEEQKKAILPFLQVRGVGESAQGLRMTSAPLVSSLTFHHLTHKHT
jgi:hypothetical protein